MGMGSIARRMMKKVVQVAGDATRAATISLLTAAIYDPVTGTMVRTDTPYLLGSAIVGVISDADMKKFNLQSTTHKAVLAMLDYEASGSPELPKAQDRILLDGTTWLIDKVIIGSMNQSIVFFVSSA
jgi:hypothetical protein